MVQMCPDEAFAHHLHGFQMVPEMVQDGSGMVQMCPHWAIAYDLQGLLMVLGTVQDGCLKVLDARVLNYLLRGLVRHRGQGTTRQGWTGHQCSQGVRFSST